MDGWGGDGVGVGVPYFVFFVGHGCDLTTAFVGVKESPLAAQ